MPRTPGKSLKVLEIASWIAGIALLAVYVGGTAWGDSERERGVVAFEEARQQQSAEDARISPQEGMRTVAPASVQVTTDSPADGSILAVLRIPGITLEVPVIYGTGEPVLRRGAGLIEGASFPGDGGNVAIAAHRDTFFRGLKDVAVGDLIELDAPDRKWVYRITELTVVEPTDVHVLADTGEPVLTLVTCYPFYFVGSAPQRFVVRAVAVEPST